MANVILDLDWFRCPKGNRIVRKAEIFRASGYDPASYTDEDWIVPNSDERVSFRPLDENDMICIAFAALRTSERLLEFINFYGPLTRTSPQWGDSIAVCLRWARRFYDLLSCKEDLLSCKEKGSKKLAAVFNSQIRESHVRSYEAVGETLPPDYAFGVLNQFIGTADLVADPINGVHLRITTDMLIGALWWQLGQKLSGGKNIRTCRHCGELFETGPGTGRHVDATFCCNSHKVRYFSLARTSWRR
jgi:hypothetical protein